MTKQFYIMLLLILLAKVALGQNGFLKTYDFGSVEDSYQITQYNGRIFVSTATFCGPECSYLSEIDSAGEILWRTEITDIDIASGTMVIHNDTITVTGNNALENAFFKMAHFSLSGEKYGQTYLIEHPTQKYTRMFQLTTQYFNGKFFICGTGVHGDTNWSLIYVVDNSGALDTLIALLPTDHISNLWESYVDNAGRLTTYHHVEFAHSAINYRKIIKFNQNLDMVWTYTSENNDDNEVIPYGCELHDGRVIISFGNPDGVRNINSIRAINPDSLVDWQHNYFSTPYRNRIILRLKTLSNGDIMGSGIYAEKNHIPKIQDATWLFRMSPEGDLLWERAYFDIDTTFNQSRAGALFDFIELANGDIMAVGYLNYTDHDMLIMRVDSTGCLNPADCHEINIITSENDLPGKNNHFEFYPNPAGNILYVSSTEFHEKIEIEIFDIMGKKVLNGSTINEKTEIDVKSLAPGIYLLCLQEKQKLLCTHRFVKIADQR